MYCITPLAWVEIQCFALTVYMPTCLHVDKRACLHAYTLAYVHAYMHLRTSSIIDGSYIASQISQRSGSAIWLLDCPAFWK